MTPDIEALARAPYIYAGQKNPIAGDMVLISPELRTAIVARIAEESEMRRTFAEEWRKEKARADAAAARIAELEREREYTGERIERAVEKAIAGDAVGVLAALSGVDAASIAARSAKP